MPSSSSSNQYTQYLTEYLLRGTTFTRPTNGIWVALYTTVPQLDGTGGVEVSTAGTGYQRVQIPDAGWTGPSGTNLQYSNTNVLTFSVPTGNWGTIVGSGLMDAQTGGNLIYICYSTTPKTISLGDGAAQIPANSIIVQRATC